MTPPPSLRDAQPRNLTSRVGWVERVKPITTLVPFFPSLRGAQPRGNLAFYAFYDFNDLNVFNGFNDLHG